jgi:hypothetical protein
LLTGDPSDGQLSEAEEELLDFIFKQYGHRNRRDIVKFVHTLPEWKDPAGSAIPIDYRDILKALNKSNDEIAAIENELEELNQVEAFMVPRGRGDSSLPLQLMW